MPHATLPSTGFQAFILCGAGASLDTFTTNLDDFPKALVPIANRPMVWYPIEWCSRMGISDITLITPPKAKKATADTLNLNPNFTQLPKVEICAPEDLDENTGTGEIFKLEEVRAIIKSDFIVLPCDLVCELDGLSLLEEWMILEGGLGAATGGVGADGRAIPMQPGGEARGRRGGLSVWYETKGEDNIKKEETDFVATTPLPRPIVPPPQDSLRGDMAQVVLSMPTVALKDKQDENGKKFPVRHSLLQKYGRVKMHTTCRDAHIYFFPYWALDMINSNATFESLGEDVLGWWAKACWQEGLGDKLGLREILQPSLRPSSQDTHGGDNQLPDDVDLSSYLTTSTIPESSLTTGESITLASRVRDLNSPSNSIGALIPPSKLTVPPILAYIQPPAPKAPLIRRVDTEDQLLNISLRLAKLPALDDKSATAHSPFAHAAKIAPHIEIPKQSRIETDNTLIGPNTTLSERVSIKESVIGSGCSIGTGAKLTKCLLMEDVVVGDFVSLTGVIVGPRARITGGPKEDKTKTELKDVKVQGGFVVEWGAQVSGETLGRSEMMGGVDGEDSGGDEFDGGENGGD